MTGVRRLLTALVTVAVLLSGAGAAVADWATGGTGAGRGRATTVPAPKTPVLTVNDGDVTAQWPAVGAGGGYASGYTVTRWTAASGGSSTVVCSDVPVRSCPDKPGLGTWYYSVRAHLGTWSGPESPRAGVTVDPAPVFTRAAVGSAVAGYVRPGGTYAVYAQVTSASSVTVDATPLGGSATQALTSGSWSFAGKTYNMAATGLVARPDVADGLTVLTLHATGALGTSATTTATVTVDGTVGAVSLGPLPARVRNGQAFTAAASDPGAGIATLGVAWCPGSTCVPSAASTVIASTTTGALSGTWSTMPADGTYRVAAIATDLAGNSAVSTVQTVQVDNTRPRVTAVSSVQPVGGTAGHLESGDVVRITFDEAVKASSLPATTTVQLSRQGNGAVQLSVPGVLAGSTSLGSSAYLAGFGTKSATRSATVTVDAQSVVLTIGAATATSDATGTGAPASVSVTPSATVLDLAGNTATGPTVLAALLLF